MSGENKKPKVAPNPAFGFWRGVGQDLVKGSLESLEGAGKQIIGVVGLLEGLYFHAIAFSDLPRGLIWWQVMVYLLPLALWLASLSFALSIFFPRWYETNINSSEMCKRTYEKVIEYKFGRFRVAAVFLELGILAVLPSLALYLLN